MLEQEPNEQSSAAVVGVHRPQHLARLGEGEYIADELQQLGLVVADAARQPPFPAGVECHAVVMLLADVDSGPDREHGRLRQLFVL